MKKITVTRPFRWYENGYTRQDFAVGEHEVSDDCAAYAEKYGCTKTEADRKAEADQKEKGENDGGTPKPARGKKASES